MLQMVPVSWENRGVMLEAAKPILTYDIGGSHITAGVCLPEPMAVLQMAVTPLPATLSSDDFIGLLLKLGRQLVGEMDRAAGAALAFPAPFDYGHGISHMRHKLHQLYGVSLRKALADHLGWRQETIHFLNDADAALLGEVAAGPALRAARVVGIMLGTGIGFSYVENGSLHATAPGNPPENEIWNLPYRDGIVEDALSSRALERDYEARTGKQRSVKAIADDWGNDLDARAVFDTFGECLGEVIREVIAPLNPDVVVFGGGISRSSQLFLPAARTRLDGLGIRLVPSVLRERAPLLGAAKYWCDAMVPLATNTATLIDAQ